jgi:hypothetical protein
MPDPINLALRWQLEWLIAYMTMAKQMFELFAGPQRHPVRSVFPVGELKKGGCVGPADLKV